MTKRTPRRHGSRPLLLPPASLVRRLLRHRERRGLDSYVAPAEQPEHTDVWGLCAEYVATDFDAMDDDANRNAAYARAFAALPQGRTRWLEIGCGASATLTRLALRHGPARAHVTAFEVNAESAAAAVVALRRDGLGCRATVLNGRSTQAAVRPRRGKRFHVLLHEVFGVFASSEGCPQMLAHSCATYLAPPTRSLQALCHSFRPWLRPPARTPIHRPPSRRAAPITIPSRAATFFTPCELSAAALDRCETVYCNSATAPSVLLVPCAPLDALALSHACAALETHRFGVGAPLHAVQEREALFDLRRDGVLHGFGVFIWVDLGVGAPGPHAAARGAARRARDGDGPHVAGADGAGAAPTATIDSAYPFGDASLDEGGGGAAGGGARPLNAFTSLCTRETRRSRTHATNWMNPLLLLPAPARVRAGDRLRVRVRAAADSTCPSYAFESELLRGGSMEAVPEALGTLSVSFQDLYPDYGELE